MSQIRTFNTAKGFSQEVLLDLLKMHPISKMKTRLGADSEKESMNMTHGQRVMRRFNSLKERLSIQQALCNEIESTIRINGRKNEIALIETIIEQLSNIQDNLEQRHSDIISFHIEHGKKVPTLSPMFNEVGSFLDKIYANIQYLMTKNKLLFTGDDDEFLEEEEIKKRIKFDNLKA